MFCLVARLDYVGRFSESRVSCEGDMENHNCLKES